jgi:hypothetical protein
VLDNRELADRFGCSEEWILTRTGIREAAIRASAGDLLSSISGPDRGRARAARRRIFRSRARADRVRDLHARHGVSVDGCIIQERSAPKPAAAFDSRRPAPASSTRS